ncbi:DUF302 domain-containing protein [Paraburkholderia sp. RL18-101-BIB-B]|uniref:DUF302 domain-containing protein n=1 Tax=Paraburkholderia sp. RL18-101-BIB-B TaxID=3031634 RepID=UPI0038B6DE7F
MGALRCRCIGLSGRARHHSSADATHDACESGAIDCTLLRVFGNPETGRPLMQRAPTAALDLPLEVLVWEDANGRTWLAFNSIAYLRRRHCLPHDLMRPVSGVAALVEAAAAQWNLRMQLPHASMHSSDGSCLSETNRHVSCANHLTTSEHPDVREPDFLGHRNRQYRDWFSPLFVSLFIHWFESSCNVNGEVKRRRRIR